MTASVSIGVPVYNGEARLAAAVQSLLGQSFGDLEIVISDNASIDGTRDICEAYAKVDRRIRYIRHPENRGASANFEDVLERSGAEFFMWAAHDDTRAPTFLEKAVNALKARPECVLAASDISLSNQSGEHVGFHKLTSGIESASPSTRYRTILRNGGWSAIYGLIRRKILSKTRRLDTIGDLAAKGIAPDYRLVELCLQGPFAYLPEYLLSCEVREQRNLALLTHCLDPNSIAINDTSFGWQFFDLWRLSGRHRLPALERAALQLEFLASAKAPGTLHAFLSTRNTEATLAALAARDKLRAFKLTLERAAFIGPSRWSLLLQKRALNAELQECRANLIDRTTRLEQASSDLVDRTQRLEQALADLDRLKPEEIDSGRGF